MNVTKEDVQEQALVTIESVLYSSILTAVDKLKLIQVLTVAALKEDME